MDANLSGGDLAEAASADGLVQGEPITLGQGHSPLSYPPLHPPQVECLVETLQLKDSNGDVVEECYRASPCDRVIQVGPVKVQLASGLAAVGHYSAEAVDKLSTLVGQAVLQAYVDLATSGDPEKLAAARSMEVGS
jgi:hypothetical protein